MNHWTFAGIVIEIIGGLVLLAVLIWAAVYGPMIDSDPRPGARPTHPGVVPPHPDAAPWTDKN